MPLTRSALSSYLKRTAILGAIGLAIAIALMMGSAWIKARVHVVDYRLTRGDPAVVSAVLADRLRVIQAEFGVRGSVEPAGDDAVRVTLRTTGDPLEPLVWLTMQGRVEFRLVHPRADAAQPPAEDGDYEVKIYRERRYVLTRLNELKTVNHPYALERESIMVVDGFRQVEFDAVGSQKIVIITFHFRPDDAAQFSRVTALNAGRNMAMLIDGEMLFPPKEIEGPITGGIVQVGGAFYIPPLRRLANILDCGSLPGPLEEVQ